MTAKEILDHLPDGLFKRLSAETNVDFKVKKLSGKTVFTLLLYSLLSERDVSLRVMEKIFSSYKFKTLADLDPHQGISFSSLSERITNIDSTYFKMIFNTCVELGLNALNKKKIAGYEVVKFDSTLVSLSSKLISIGFRSGGQQEKVKQLKFTVGYSNQPEIVKFFHEPTYNSENKALGEVIKEFKGKKDEIIVVDAGLQSRDAYDAIDSQEKMFITPIKTTYKYKLVKENAIPEKQKDGVQIEYDRIVTLFNRRQRPSHEYRVVKCHIEEKEADFVFLTNEKALSAFDIALIYKQRWEIEVFFKNMKQHLNFKHIINRSINGIKVILYTKMALAILIGLYKQKNKIKGFKEAKICFKLELEEALIKEIIKISGGNPDTFNPKTHFF